MKKLSILNPVLIATMVLFLLSLGGCATTGGGTEGSSPVYLIVILVLIVGMFYLFTIRPMRQREKQHDLMVEGLQKGDQVITAGGMFGKIDTIDEDSIVIIIESGAKVRVTKGGILKREE